MGNLCGSVHTLRLTIGIACSLLWTDEHLDFVAACRAAKTVYPALASHKAFGVRAPAYQAARPGRSAPPRDAGAAVCGKDAGAGQGRQEVRPGGGIPVRQVVSVRRQGTQKYPEGTRKVPGRCREGARMEPFPIASDSG